MMSTAELTASHSSRVNQRYRVAIRAKADEIRPDKVALRRPPLERVNKTVGSTDLQLSTRYRLPVFFQLLITAHHRGGLLPLRLAGRDVVIIHAFRVGVVLGAPTARKRRRVAVQELARRRVD